MIEWAMDFLKRRGWDASYFQKSGRIFCTKPNFRTGDFETCMYLEIYRRSGHFPETRLLVKDQYVLHLTYGVVSIEP